MFDVDGTVVIVPDPGWEREADKAAIPRLNRLLDAVYKDVLRLVPEDTEALKLSVRKVPARVRPVARVKVGGPGLEYWADQEYGTDPHVIESTGKWPLRNKETGEVFGRVVNHPGNEAQPYLRPALYRRRPF
jgi:hypothetical protein